VRLALVLLAVLAVAAPAAAAATKPTLRLSSEQPVTVRGAHFARLERVRVSFSAGGAAATRTVRTTESGALVATAPADFAYSPCGAPLVVIAVGARGDRATLRIAQRECPSA
jgi:hypothetical protein